jgi:hypothetical protein
VRSSIQHSGTERRDRAITGVVVDVKGAPVSSAQIDLTIAGSSAVTRTVFSDADGNFIVPSLPVGAYDLAVKAAGFSTSKYNSVDARLSETTRLNPSLGAPVAAKTEATAGTAHAEDVVMIATPPVVLLETGNPATGPPSLARSRRRSLPQREDR